MSIEVDFTVEQDFLIIEARGSRSRETVGALVHQVLDLCEEHQKERVLVDVGGMAGRLKVFESFQIVIDEFPALRKRGILRRVAIMDRAENLQRINFFETVARNRGFNLRAFADRNDATSWLTENPEQPAEPD
jgi:hypothetical protein